MSAPVSALDDRSVFGSAASISDFLQLWLENELLEPSDQAVLLEYYASYRRHFPRRLRHYYSRQTREVIELIRNIPDARVLEVGCGTGTESLWMAMQGARVHAVELRRDRFNVANARKQVLEKDLGRGLKCTFTNQSILQLDAQASYDVIWMEQTFHHLEPRSTVVRKIVDLLRPGGYVVISESNSLNPFMQAQVISQRGFKTIAYFEDHTGQRVPYGDERIVSARTLTRLFSAQGVQKTSVSHFRLFPNKPIFDAWLGFEESVPAWLVPAFTHYNYVGRKGAEDRQEHR